VSADFIVGVRADACNVTFFPREATKGLPLAYWSPCTASTSHSLITDPLLDENGSVLYAVTSTGIFAVAASGASPGSQLWVSDFSVTPHGTLVGALLVNGTLVLVDTAGVSYLQATAFTGSAPPPPTVSQQSALNCSASDTFLAPPVAFHAPSDSNNQSATSGFAVLSAQGCLTLFNLSGAVLHTVESDVPLSGLPTEGAVVSPPLFDADSGSVFWITTNAWVCCASLSLSACDGWSSPCLSLSTNALIYAGLSLSPPSKPFHNGELYSVDSNGLLFVVRLSTETAGNSSGSSGDPIFQTALPVVAAPVLVVNAWGYHKNGMVLISSGGPLSSGACGSEVSAACLYALDVGNNGLDDDDDLYDDDYYATRGPIWALPLLFPAPGTNASQTYSGSKAGLALTDSGHVLVATSAGIGVACTGPGPDPGPNVVLLEAVVVVAIVVGLMALVVALVAVVRARRRRRQLDRELEQEDAAYADLEQRDSRKSTEHFLQEAIEEGIEHNSATSRRSFVSASTSSARTYSLNKLSER
jgi:multisubunit Na+/H+ antiporter MnhC subunit